MSRPELSRRGFLAGSAAVAGGALASRAAAGSSLAAQESVESTVEKRVRQALEEHDIPGASVAVVRDGEVTLTAGYGVADRESGRAAEATTPFRVGSVSKAVLWTAVARQIARGDLDAETPIGEYLPDDLPWWDDPVTLAHLATHTGGFEATNLGMWYPSPEAVGPLRDHLEASSPAQVRPPGEIGSYSNHGAALAGQTLASAVGDPFPAAIDDALLGPAGMTTSSFQQPLPESMRDVHAVGHDAPTVGGAFLGLGIAPAGALSTTATDMARFVQLHVDDGVVDGERVLAPETVEFLQRQWFTHDEALDGMAFGLVEDTGREARVLHHNGATQSFHSNLVLVPEAGFGLFVAFNSANAAAAREAVPRDILDELFPRVESDVPEPDGQPTRADELAGTYRSLQVPETKHDSFPGTATAGTIEVSVADDGALLLSRGGEQQRWVETAPLTFANAETGEWLAFGEDDGEVRYLFLDGSPTALASVEWHEQILLHGVAFLVAVMGLLSGVTLPVHDSGRSPREWLAALRSDPRLQATAVASAGATAFLAFLGVTLLYLIAAPLSFLSHPAPAYRVAFALPVVGTVAAAGSVLAALRGRGWGRRRWLHYTATAASLVVAAALLWHWNLTLPP